VIAPVAASPYSEHMFDGAVLGVDPGLASTGLAALAMREARPEVGWTGTIRTAHHRAEAHRLQALYGAVREAITANGVSVVAVERVMWGRNVGSAMGVARATGVVLLAAADSAVPVEEYAPLEVKMAVTGVGNAGKEAVRRALVRVHGLHAIPEQPDAADAVAVALCHLQQYRIRRLAKGAIR
jgi:crossover junction endodeoxyribonuclease RuvC